MGKLERGNVETLKRRNVVIMGDVLNKLTCWLNLWNLDQSVYKWGTLLCNCVKLPKMMGTEGVNMLFSVNFPFSTYVFTDFSLKHFSSADFAD